MSRKSGLEIKKLIIKFAKQGEISLRRLETKLNTNNKTIKTHCKELEYFGVIKLTTHKSHLKNNQTYTTVKITSYSNSIK